MLRISKLGDYGMVIMAHLTKHPAPISNAQQISQATGIGLPTVKKILYALNKAGLVHTKQGVSGGYQLSMAPKAISILDMLHAIEGNFALTTCNSQTPCDKQDNCPIQHGWGSIHRAIQSLLTTITLEHLSTPDSEWQLKLHSSMTTLQQTLALKGASPHEC
jgi:FeS assembly SUF system regulator